jgi:hypothetical protein
MFFCFREPKVFPAEDVFSKDGEQNNQEFYGPVYNKQSTIPSGMYGEESLNPLENLISFACPLFTQVNVNENLKYVVFCAWVARELSNTSSTISPEILAELLNEQQKQKLAQLFTSAEPSNETIGFRVADIEKIAENKKINKKLKQLIDDREITFTLEEISNIYTAQKKLRNPSISEKEKNFIYSILSNALFPPKILKRLLNEEQKLRIEALNPNEFYNETISFKVKEIYAIYQAKNESMSETLQERLLSAEIRLKAEELRNAFVLLKKVDDKKTNENIKKLIVTIKPSQNKRIPQLFDLNAEKIKELENLPFPLNIKCLSEILIKGTSLNYASGMYEMMRRQIESSLVRETFTALKDCCVNAFKDKEFSNVLPEIAIILGRPDLITFIPHILHLLLSSEMMSMPEGLTKQKKAAIEAAADTFVNELGYKTLALYRARGKIKISDTTNVETPLEKEPSDSVETQKESSETLPKKTFCVNRMLNWLRQGRYNSLELAQSSLNGETSCIKR